MRSPAKQSRRYDFLADCPARLAIDLISNTWTIIVLHALRETPKRPRQLCDDIGGISPKVLNDTLRRLERQGLVTHRRVAEAPPRVDYELTDLGHSLLIPIDALASWVEEHAEQLACYDPEESWPSSVNQAQKQTSLPPEADADTLRSEIHNSPQANAKDSATQLDQAAARRTISN